MTPSQFELAYKRAIAYLTRPLRLMEYRLPAGDCGSINIGWARNGAAINLDPSLWLGAGFEGVRLIGDGKTSLRCTAWDGVTLGVGRHDGIVQLDGVALYGGSRCAIAFGEQHFDGERRPDGSLVIGTQRVTCPKFQLRFLESSLTIPEPAALNGARAMWGIFLYQGDELIRDVEMDCGQARQHPDYHHGSAGRGWYWLRVKVRSTAGECFKVRSDATETAWAGRNVWAILQKCQLEGIVRQPHDDYGPCGVNLQGAACHALIEDTLIRGSLGSPHCVMVSSEDQSYDIDTGSLLTGAGNGNVMVRRTAMTGASTGFWQNELMNVYRQGGAQKPCLGLVVDASAAYGANTQLGLSGVPKGQLAVTGCNTAAIKATAQRAGIDTGQEAVIPTSTRLVPVSEGMVR